jgi:hypothetical protein
MKPENLHARIVARPFRPFTLLTARGTCVEVRSPEWIAHPPRSWTAAVVTGDEVARVFDVGTATIVELGPPYPE